MTLQPDRQLVFQGAEGEFERNAEDSVCTLATFTSGTKASPTLPSALKNIVSSLSFTPFLDTTKPYSELPPAPPTMQSYTGPAEVTFAPLVPC